MTEYNTRQIRTMLDQLAAYRAGTIDLRWLIASLESLLNALEGMPNEWRLRARRCWGILEEVYSGAVVNNAQLDTPQTLGLINRGVSQLEQLLKETLGASGGENSNEA